MKQTYYSLAGASDALAMHSTTLMRAVDVGLLDVHLSYVTGVGTEQPLFTGASLRSFQRIKLAEYAASPTPKRRQMAARLKRVRVK